MGRELNKTREELAEMFLTALEEQRLPWHQPWLQQAPGLGASVNAVTGKHYRGINALMLWVASIKAGYSDPRWCSYNQAKSKGWHVLKGESGTHIELWKAFDRKTRKSYDFSEIYRIIQADPDREEDFTPYSKCSVVFNGSQIEGIPQLPGMDEVPEYGNALLAEFTDAYLQTEGIPLMVRDYAAYSPSRDELYMPEKDLFQSELDYYDTLLHECAHSTGHVSRLNRDMLHHDPEKYAIEELRAEMAGAFLLSAAGCEVPASITENNKAYVQSWADRIKEDKNVLFSAIKDAYAITDFVSEHGQLEGLLEKYKTEDTPMMGMAM